MKLSTQVAAALALLLIVIAVVAGWQLVLIGRLHQSHQQLANTDLEVSRTSLRMRSDLERLGSLTQRFFVLGDPAYRAELRRIRGLIDVDLEHLATLPLAPPEPQGDPLEIGDQIELLALQWDRYTELAAELEAPIPEREAPAGARQQLADALNEIQVNLREMDEMAVQRAELSIASSSRRANRARRVAMLVGGGAVLLALALAAWVSRGTVRSLNSLTAAAHAIAGGELTHRVPIEGPLEIQSLARDFNSMAERLEELDRMKSAFVSTVSHDLKAPLASMQETTRLMLEDESVDRRRLLELNLQSADRLQNMISDILDVARLESGVVKFELEVVDLLDTCRRVAGEAEGLIQAGELTLEVDFPSPPTMVRADPGFLQQAIWNLLSNAIKFSPKGGTVGLTVRRHEQPTSESVEIRISDEGPGIPDEDKPYIFERFFRSRRHEQFSSGTGLGLAIARSVVERLEGTIGLEDRDGGGSVFFVLLPVVDLESAR